MLAIFKKKKNNFKAVCELTRQPLERESTYLLTAAEVISSKRFWDNKMTEPETLSYTVAHFKDQDPTASKIRKMIFDKYANEKPWVISDAALHLFDVDRQMAKQRGEEWWDSQGTASISDANNSLSILGPMMEEYKKYAIQEAGRSMVSI